MMAVTPRPFRLGLVGCGGMSKNFAHTFSSLGDRVRMSAVVDVERRRAEEAAAYFPGARPSTDYREILPEVDAVLLVLPHHLHHPVGMACLQSKKHVLLEKPMALSEEECLDLLGAAREHQRVLMIAYVMRFHPLVLKLKELLDQKTYGEVFQISIWTEQHTEYPPDHWASKAATLGGGQLFSHGCHYIDLLLWFLGKPVEGTHLGTNFGTPWMEMEGTSNVAIKFESGALGYHFGTWGARGTRIRYALQAHCTEGMLEIDWAKGKLFFHRDRREIDDPGKRSEEMHREMEDRSRGATVLMDAVTIKQTDKELGHFLDCIQTGRRPTTTPEDSLQGLRVIWKLYEAERNKVVADLRGLGLGGSSGTAT